MWLSAIKLAVSAGSKIYANKQKTKIAMSDAQLMHAEKMARGDEAYQGKLLEARKALLIADMTEDFMKEEKQITSQFDHDPLLKLKQREVDLKAMDAERKMKEDEARINLDRAKMVQAKDLNERKLDQNEDLAQLRADTAIEKSMMSADVKLTSDAMKARDVNVLKGRRS